MPGEPTTWALTKAERALDHAMALSTPDHNRLRVAIARALDAARKQGDLEGAARVARDGIAQWVAANQRIAELTADSRSYVPQEIAAELLDVLSHAGMGKSNHGNTLHGMTMEAIEAIATAREEGRRAGFLAGAEAMRTAAVLCCATEQGGGWAAARIIRIEPSTLPGALATKEPA